MCTIGKKTTTPNFPLGPNDKDDVIKINARPHGDLTSSGCEIIVQHILLPIIKKKKYALFYGCSANSRNRNAKFSYRSFLLFNFLIEYKKKKTECGVYSAPAVLLFREIFYTFHRALLIEISSPVVDRRTRERSTNTQSSATTPRPRGNIRYARGTFKTVCGQLRAVLLRPSKTIDSATIRLYTACVNTVTGKSRCKIASLSQYRCPLEPCYTRRSVNLGGPRNNQRDNAYGGWPNDPGPGNRR